MSESVPRRRPTRDARRADEGRPGKPLWAVTGSPVNAATSWRIDMLRFLLITGLVFLHYGTYPSLDLSPFRGFQESPYPVAVFVNTFTLYFFFCAVPLLSAISGWLFFKNFEPSFHFYSARIKGRARSIFLPMIVWNGVILAGLVAAAALAPGLVPDAFVPYDVTVLGPGVLVNALVGVTRNPIGFQFWFLRDLFLTVLLSPLLGLAIRRIPLVAAAVCFLVWLIDYNLEIFFRTDVLFFFYLGGLARTKGLAIGTPAPRLGIALLLLFAALVAARAMGPYWVAEESGLGILLFDYGTRLMRIVGVAGIWLGSSLLVGTGFGRAAARLGSLAFFLYAAHWPLNQLVKFALDAVLPAHSELVLLTNYVATAAITVGLSLLMARLLSTVAPNLFDLLSGGRSRARLRQRASTQELPESR
jgi:surface polysaccharide O-acyltransferase-like enzyme